MEKKLLRYQNGIYIATMVLEFLAALSKFLSDYVSVFAIMATVGCVFSWLVTWAESEVDQDKCELPASTVLWVGFIVFNMVMSIIELPY